MLADRCNILEGGLSAPLTKFCPTASCLNWNARGSFKNSILLAHCNPSTSMNSMPTQGASRAVICAVRHTALSGRYALRPLQTSPIKLQSPISTVRRLDKRHDLVQRRCSILAAAESNGSSPSSSGLSIDLRGETSKPSHVQSCWLGGCVRQVLTSFNSVLPQERRHLLLELQTIW